MTGPPPPSWVVDVTAAAVSQIVPGVWRLRLPAGWPSVDHVNAYVVERSDGIMLIDCGCGGDPTCLLALRAAVSQTGHRLEDIRVLVLTHAHSDHVGVADEVLALTGAALCTHSDTAHFYDVLRDPTRAAAARRRRARREGVPSARLDAYADVREEVDGARLVGKPDIEARTGAVLASALGDWRVVETPGHAPSHINLVQDRHGLVIVGDLLCIAFVPWMDYGCSPDPVGETLRSLDVLECQAANMLALPGHGRALADVAGAVAVHRAGYTSLLDAVRDALADAGEGDAYTLTERLHGSEDDASAVGHLNEVLCLLRHLRLAGEVERVELPANPSRYRLRPASHASG